MADLSPPPQLIRAAETMRTVARACTATEGIGRPWEGGAEAAIETAASNSMATGVTQSSANGKRRFKDCAILEPFDACARLLQPVASRIASP